MDFLWFELLTIGLTGGLVSLALPFAQEQRAWPLLAFVTVAAIQAAALMVPFDFGWGFGTFNWTGKAASLGVGLAAVPLLRLTRAEVGLALPRGRRAWIATAAGVAAAVTLFTILCIVFGANHAPSPEAFAYEATMPGLEEELAFRGIGMALLARGFPRTRLGLPVWLLPLAVTSLWFTAVHVVAIDDGRISFEPVAVVAILPMGVLLALTRVFSGSLLGPLIAHNAANTSAFLLAFVLPAP